MTPEDADRFVALLDELTTEHVTLFARFLILYHQRRLDMKYGWAAPLPPKWWAEGQPAKEGAS